MAKIVYRTEIFAEDGCYVGICPELNVSSFGDTPDDAKGSLEEAMDAFFEECRRMGTLNEVLVESGFVRKGDTWKLRERIIESQAASVL